MAMLDRPRLRPLAGRHVRHQGGDYVALEDPSGSFPGQVLIPTLLYRTVVRHCDGTATQDEIRARARREAGLEIPADDLAGLVDQLDRSLVLDGPAFRSFAEGYAVEAVRPAALAGRSYPDDPRALGAELARYFADPRGSGPIATPGPAEAVASPVRAVLCPHIDFARGGTTYTWAYRELIEKSDADTFVILGVAHRPCRHRFALTRKDFATPLGLVATDRGYVGRVAEAAGPHLFDDELAHRAEHSIEFHAVFLQYLLGGRRPFRIVPILVGSFHDLMERGAEPSDDPEVARMVEALRSAEAGGGKVAYIGSIDLCHVGPEFGDPAPADDALLDRIRAFDRSLLDRAEAGDASGWFGVAAGVGNRWRVCGLAATYTMLRAIGPARGRLLRYDQAVDPARTCCVSFASVAYDSATEGEPRA